MTQVLQAVRTEQRHWIVGTQMMSCIWIFQGYLFDLVPHEHLLRKLFAHGVGCKLFDCIKAFLQGGRQRMSVNGASSSWSDMLSGIP